ncbi:MAG: VWA domain-containing protein [Spirochaetota bacterium]
MWVFREPLFLALLVLVPVGIFFRHFRRNRGGNVAFPFHVWGGTGFTPRYRGVRLLRGIGILSFWVGVSALIVATARPATVERQRVFLTRGVDIMIVLDESPSMAARDFVPENRFETAREVIRRFVERRENDPIGLVSFGREATLRVPPTTYYEEVLRALEGLQIMSLGDGTAIGMGLALASLHLSSSSASEKVVILLTDGENNAGEIFPETAATVADQLGIRIYAIGIGNTDETRLEFTDPDTGQTFRGTFQGGFDEELLRRIAESSGGAYFYAGTSGTLAGVFEAIDSIETVEKRVRIDVKTTPHHRPVIFFGLAAIGLDVLIRKWLLREVL